MADWAGVYKFASADDLSTRITRIERGRQTLRAGSLVSPSGNFQSIPNGIIDGNNKVALVSGVTAIGSIPPAGVSGNFAFTATSTSITAYWDGTNGSVKLTLLRVDKSVVQIPGNSLTVSGLVANTNAYGFLPFWSPFNNCGIGFVLGDSGSPQFAFSPAAQTIQNGMQQLLQGREALTNGFIKWATPATGTSGPGSGTGGGSGGIGPGCVMLGTDLKPLGNEPIETIHHPWTDWVRIETEPGGVFTRGLNCTPNHPLYDSEAGKVDASFFLGKNRWIITNQGEEKVTSTTQFVRKCTKVSAHMKSGHLFFANGFMSHNVKPA